MISRRLFVRSGAMAMLSLGFAPSFLARTAEAAGARRRLLVAIFQRGAVDGLNMVVPFGEAEYYRLRPTIAVARPGADDGALALDDVFGLHPRLAPLVPYWTNGSLAVVHAAGSHDGTRSHFDAQDYMETATPGIKSTRDGWLNRALQAADAEATPLRGVAVSRQMPRALRGPAPALAIGASVGDGRRGGSRGPGDGRGRGDMGAAARLEEAYAGSDDPRLRQAARDAFDAMRTLQAIDRDYRPAPGVEYPRSPFGQALQEIARLAKADVGLEIAFAESGGWDHHVNEGGATGQLAGRLDDLGRGLAALAADLGDRLADTVILTMSEFGRAVAENGNRGTDHGHGNAMLAIGGPVQGGRVYGRWPGLDREARFEGRDLAVTTDFRDVFGEIVTAHLGLTRESLAHVFPGHAPGATLGLIR